MDKDRLTRRDFLKVSALAVAGTALIACDEKLATQQKPTEMVNNEATALPTDNKESTKKPVFPTKTPKPTDVSGVDQGTPVPTVEMKITEAVDPIEKLIENASRLAGKDLGECGVTYPESIKIIPNAKDLVVEEDGNLKIVESNYKMSEKEQKLGKALADAINLKNPEDINHNPLKFNPSNIRVTYFFVNGSDDVGNEASTPIVAISQLDLKNTSRVNAFIAFSVDSKGEYLPPGETSTLEFMRLYQIGDLDNDGSVDFSVSDNAALQDRQLVGDFTPMFRVSKTEDGNVATGFYMPPYEDIVRTHYLEEQLKIAAGESEQLQAYSTRRVDINDPQNLDELKTLVPSSKTIDDAKYARNNEAVRKANKELIERNSLEKKQEEIKNSINGFLTNPDEYKADGNPLITENDGKDIGINYSEAPKSFLRQDGTQSFERTFFNMTTVFLGAYADDDDYLGVFGSKDRNGKPFAWTGRMGTFNHGWVNDGTVFKSLTNANKTFRDASDGGPEMKSTEALRSVEQLKTGTQAVAFAMYVDDKSENFIYTGGNIAVYNQEQ